MSYSDNVDGPTINDPDVSSAKYDDAGSSSGGGGGGGGGGSGGGSGGGGGTWTCDICNTQNSNANDAFCKKCPQSWGGSRRKRHQKRKSARKHKSRKTRARRTKSRRHSS